MADAKVEESHFENGAVEPSDAPEHQSRIPLDVHPVYTSVVKISTFTCSPNYSLPWQMNQPQQSSSSGFIISGRRIMTNAHCVTYHRSIRVCKHGDHVRYTAKVLHISHDEDLALLSVEDDEFWQDTTHLEFGELPHLEDTIVTVGYPTGGDNLCITKGVVSRVEMVDYTHAWSYLPAIQVDAAINPGSSGGPALNGTEVVGVAFSSMKADKYENVGYAIPVTIVRRFLTDIEQHGSPTGVPSLGYVWDSLENPSVRKYFRMEKRQHGVVVSKLHPLLEVNEKLHNDDVILALDGHEIADDGTIALRSGERIQHMFISCMKYVSDPIVFTILRNGEKMDIEVILEKAPHLVPLHLYDQPVTWFIFAGLVFIPLSMPLLRCEFGYKWRSYTSTALQFQVDKELKKYVDEERVVVKTVLPSEFTVGYHDLYFMIVKSVNGIEIRNVAQIAEIIDNCQDEFVRIDFTNDHLLVLETRPGHEVTPTILEENAIPYDRSENVRNACDGRIVLATSTKRELGIENGGNKVEKEPEEQDKQNADDAKHWD